MWDGLRALRIDHLEGRNGAGVMDADRNPAPLIKVPSCQAAWRGGNFIPQEEISRRVRVFCNIFFEGYWT